MTEEEKQAIKMLEKFITEHKLYNIKQNDGLEDNIKIVVNLINKQQKEIEYFKNEKERIGKLYYGASETCFKNKEIILKQQKEIEIWKETENDYEHEIARYKEEIEELKKPKYLYNANTGEITKLENSNYISKDKIREILNKYGKKDIGYAVDFYKEIEKLLEE